MIRTKYFDANTEGVSKWAYLAALIRLRGTHLRLDIVLETVDALAVSLFFVQVQIEGWRRRHWQHGRGRSVCRWRVQVKTNFLPFVFHHRIEFRSVHISKSRCLKRLLVRGGHLGNRKKEGFFPWVAYGVRRLMPCWCV